MKNFILAFLFLWGTSTTFGQYAQWNLNATNAYYNNGNVGIGTTIPRGKFDVDGAGDIYLSDDPNAGTVQSIYLPGHIFIAPYYGSNVSYLQARRLDNSGTTSLRIRTINNGALTEAMHIEGNGNVGIGVTSPQKKLDILTNGNGGLRVTGNNSAYQGSDINIERTSTSSEVGKGSTLQFDDNQFNSHAIIQNSSGGLQFFNLNDYSNGWSERMRITLDGNVGIGTTNPGSFKLAVEGKIGAREVNVLVGPGWPDYVFEKSYKLPSLDELNTYIKVNKHLPEVPSACTIEENGVNLGEMNMLLLKKVEELTLYVIEMKKEIADQAGDLVKQQQKIEIQEKRIVELEVK